MIIILDNRTEVASGFVACFGREGVAAAAILEDDFSGWWQLVATDALNSIELMLLGQFAGPSDVVRQIRARSSVPVISVTDSKSLCETLELLACGCDDVIPKPVHAREIIARVGAIRLRMMSAQGRAEFRSEQISIDGRDTWIFGKTVYLPRREQRILAYFLMNKGRFLSRSQIYDFVYGAFNDHVDECVVESHISKLRKKLRYLMNFDPIQSQRFCGYRFIDNSINQQKSAFRDFS